MKNFWKILAAVMVIALPFVAASCSSDDDEDKPKTYEYKWEYTGISSTTQATLVIISNMNNILGTAIKAKGFTVDTENQKFSISCLAEEIDSKDSQVKSAFYGIQDDLKTAAKDLPGSPYIKITGRKQLINEKVK